MIKKKINKGIISTNKEINKRLKQLKKGIDVKFNIIRLHQLGVSNLKSAGAIAR